MATLTKKDGTGLFQWVDQYANIIKGCPHSCLYCYAMIKEVCRFKRKTYEAYGIFEKITPIIRFKDGISITTIKKIDDWIMFPGTHDLFPEILPETLSYLKDHLEIGNKLLIVSKPHSEVIKALTNTFKTYKEQLLFRFTITSADQDLLNYFEPHAPSFLERFDCLKYCFHNGFHTSVSIEPFLDKDPLPLIKLVAPYCTDSIWLGALTKLTYLKKLLSVVMYEYLLKITAHKNLYSIITNISLLSQNIQDKIYFKESFDPILKKRKNTMDLYSFILQSKTRGV